MVNILIFCLFQVTYQDLPIATICPEGSWAEVDPLQLLSTSIDCINLTVNNLKQLDIDPEDIVSIGLTNQVRVRFLIKLTKFCSNINQLLTPCLHW